MVGVKGHLFRVNRSKNEPMAKFETVAIGELKHRLPAKLLPLVEEYRQKRGVNARCPCGS
jgi:hypothetical protein